MSQPDWKKQFYEKKEELLAFDFNMEKLLDFISQLEKDAYKRGLKENCDHPPQWATRHYCGKCETEFFGSKPVAENPKVQSIIPTDPKEAMSLAYEKAAKVAEEHLGIDSDKYVNAAIEVVAQAIRNLKYED